MAKLTLGDITTSGTGFDVQINANNTLLEAALENTLSRDGISPNAMGVALDMNSFNINNLADAVLPQSAATLAQLTAVQAAVQAVSGLVAGTEDGAVLNWNNSTLIWEEDTGVLVTSSGVDIRQLNDTVITGNNDADGGIRIINRTNSTQVALLGYPSGGGDDLRIQNFINGSEIRLIARDTGDVDRILLRLDADGNTSISDGTSGGGIRFDTSAVGFNLRGVLGNDPTAGGIQDALFSMGNANENVVALLGFSAGTTLGLRNTVHGGDVVLTAEDAAGTEQNMFTFDPDVFGIGFFGVAAAARPVGVAVTAAGIHAALVTLGLIT